MSSFFFYFPNYLIFPTYVQKFLLLEELEHSSNVEQTDLKQDDDKCYVQLKDVTAKWDGVSWL